MRALILCLLLSQAVFADVIHVEDTTGTGIGPDDAIAVLQFVRTTVAEEGHQTSAPGGKYDFELRPKLMRLGKSYVLSIEKRENGNLVFSTSLKAATVEELDEVAKRVTRAVLKGVSASRDATVDDVTEDESTRGTKRKPARKGYYFAFGPANLARLNTSGVGLYAGGAYAWDVNWAMIKLRADFNFNGGAMLADVGLGASYFFSASSVAPFIGVDVGFGLARVDQGNLLTNETEAGFTLGPVAGITLLRTSAINLELSARAVFLLKRLSTGTPLACTARVGLYF